MAAAIRVPSRVRSSGDGCRDADSCCFAVLAPLLIFITTRAGKSTAEKRKELWDRYRSWIWLVLCILIPILAGAFWTILAVALLSLLCYREYARITGLFRERTISFIVVIGILLITFAELDNWYRLLVALFPLTVALIAIGGLIPDQPKGYIQRVGLGVSWIRSFRKRAR